MCSRFVSAVEGWATSGFGRAQARYPPCTAAEGILKVRFVSFLSFFTGYRHDGRSVHYFPFCQFFLFLQAASGTPARHMSGSTVFEKAR